MSGIRRSELDEKSRYVGVIQEKGGTITDADAAAAPADAEALPVVERTPADYAPPGERKEKGASATVVAAADGNATPKKSRKKAP